ncbi:MAG: hypothetical protein ACI3Y5_03875, partial [Prevotella sp.]
QPHHHPIGFRINHKAINIEGCASESRAIDFVEGWLHLTSLNIGCTAFHVYRLEENGSLLQEGGVRLPLWALRACSYKTEAEARHQGLCPPHTLQGVYNGFCHS